MSLSTMPIQAPYRQLCRSQPRRLKEALPLIGTASATEHQDEEEIKTQSHHGGTHSAENASFEVDYIPPSNLQQQVQNLERMLQQEDWVKQSERGRMNQMKNDDESSCWNGSSHDLALVASMIADMDTDDEDDDFESMESIRSLKEELKWAELELGPFPTSEMKTAGEKEGNCSPITLTKEANGSEDHTFSVISDCESDASAPAVESLNLAVEEESSAQPPREEHTLTTSSAPQTCNEKNTGCHQEDISSLNQAGKVKDGNGDLSLVIKSIRRTEPLVLLVLPGALFVASLLLGDPRKKIHAT